MNMTGGPAGHQITASFDKLETDCKDAARYYLRCAISEIDDVLGDGYAAKHPDLIAAFMRTAATESHAVNTKLLGQDIAAAIGLVADAIEMKE